MKADDIKEMIETPSLKKYLLKKLRYRPKGEDVIIKIVDFVKNITWAIAKFFFLKWLFVDRIYPVYGFEKTIIFISLLLLVVIRGALRSQK